MQTLLLYTLWTLALTATAAMVQESATPRRPVVLIPGFASTQLVAWRKHSCSHSIQKNLYRDVKVGDRIWVDVARILAQGDCWLRCMKLHMENQTELECKLRAGEGFTSISELDPGFVTGPLSTIWRVLMVDLVDHFHFEPDEIIVAPYDWRLPPSKLQERDNYFLSLKRKIENVMALHGDLTGGSGVVVIAHSMGNNIFRYFLAWLKHEVGRHHWQEWIDTHISAYFAVAAPLLGSPEAMELLTSGITQGLPLPQSEMRKLVATFGSILSFMPIPSIPPTSHDADVLISVRFSTASATDASAQDIIRNYTTVDIASGKLFRDMAVYDPLFGHLETIRKRFYVDDDVLDAFSPWERPPIASVYAVYGTNLDTKYNYRYQDTDIAGHWFQLSLENESGNHKVCSKTGDGTVPYHSLSWAHTWLGPSGTAVNVTRAPQSVYFSAKQTKTFQAHRQGKEHHADYAHAVNKNSVCDNPDPAQTNGVSSTAGSSFFDGIFGGKSNVDEVAFYESTHAVNGRTWTTSVWEVESARHREILSNSAFLRELRTELRHVFQGLSGADKSERPPMLDTDCYWNYRQARCEFPEFCQYRYVFGDVVLDQSCRLRIHPPRGLDKTKPKRLENPPGSLLLSDGLRNSGITTSHECGKTATCGMNGTPLDATLPYEPWDDDDRMTALVPRGMPGYCIVPCEYCRYPTSYRRAYAH